MSIDPVDEYFDSLPADLRGPHPAALPTLSTLTLDPRALRLVAADLDARMTTERGKCRCPLHIIRAGLLADLAAIYRTDALRIEIARRGATRE